MLIRYFISYTLLVPFKVRTVLIPHGMDSIMCRKNCWEILVHINMIASHSCCRWCESPVPPHPKDAPLDWLLLTVEPIWVHWTHYQKQSSRMAAYKDLLHLRPNKITNEDLHKLREPDEIQSCRIRWLGRAPKGTTLPYNGCHQEKNKQTKTWCPKTTRGCTGRVSE